MIPSTFRNWYANLRQLAGWVCIYIDWSFYVPYCRHVMAAYARFLGLGGRRWGGRRRWKRKWCSGIDESDPTFSFPAVSSSISGCCFMRVSRNFSAAALSARVPRNCETMKEKRVFIRYLWESSEHDAMHMHGSNTHFLVSKAINKSIEIIQFACI